MVVTAASSGFQASGPFGRIMTQLERARECHFQS
jgi:hypothetical protein